MEYDELIYACALNRIFINRPAIAKQIIDTLKHPSTIFGLSEKELVEIIPRESGWFNKFFEKKYLILAEKECSWASSNGVKISYYKDPEYPYRLKECFDAPILLFQKGECDLNSQKTIAVVGARKPSPYGVEMCKQIVTYLSETDCKPLIISGLAYGIDITAHLTAMDKGLKTVAVMATGIDDIYPASHRNSATRIKSQGAVLTEFPKGSLPFPHNFLQRNRIIAGLSDALILVESTLTGGGMVTARLACSYDREVLAIPGKIDEKASQGCNFLIKNYQAQLISHLDDIGKFLNLSRIESISEPVLDFEGMSEEKKTIIRLLQDNPVLSFDVILRNCPLDIGSLNLHLIEMELAGIIKNSDNFFSLMKVS